MKNVQLAAVLTLTLCAFLSSFAQAASIVNPSFETGDLTGWDMYPPDHMLVASGSASDGTYYLTADVEWAYQESSPFGPWFWSAECRQEIQLSPRDDRLSVDIRTVGYDMQSLSFWVSTAGQVTGGNPGQPAGVIKLIPENAIATAAAPSGFTRYTIDISEFATFSLIAQITISAWDRADSVPAGPVEFSVDNFQVTPEPATILLLTIAGGVLLRRRS